MDLPAVELQSGTLKDILGPMRDYDGFRFVPALKGVAFAMNAIVTAGVDSTLAVGDRLAVTWQSQARWAFRAAGAGEKI